MTDITIGGLSSVDIPTDEDLFEVEQAGVSKKVSLGQIKAHVQPEDTGGGVEEAPGDGKLYGRKDESWVEVPASGGGVEEAPGDGKLYGRKDESWVEVPPSDAGIEDAPDDGKLYGRKDESWVEVPPSDAGIEDAPDDGKLYGRKDESWVEVPAGGDGAFDIDALPDATSVNLSDFIPVAQAPVVPARFWRVRGIESIIQALRVYGLQFRTAPSVPEYPTGGTVLSSGFTSPELAFDEDGATYAAESGSGDRFIGYEFPEPKAVLAVSFWGGTAADAARMPKQFTLEYSLDGETYFPVLEKTGLSYGDYTPDVFNTFAVPGEVAQRKVSVAQLLAQVPPSDAGIEDAPEDGKLYGRKDATWAEVPEGAEFDIDGLPSGAQAFNVGYVPSLQPIYPLSNYWRLVIETNAAGVTAGDDSLRIYELEFRDTYGGRNTSLSFSGGNLTGASLAFNGNTSGGDDFAYNEGQDAPWDIIRQSLLPSVTAAVAIFAADADYLDKMPGKFTLEYRDSNSEWVAVQTFNATAADYTAGQWTVFNAEPLTWVTEKVTISQLLRQPDAVLLDKQNVWTQLQTLEQSSSVSHALHIHAESNISAAIRMTAGGASVYFGTRGGQGELYVGPMSNMSYRVLHTGNLREATAIQLIAGTVEEAYASPAQLRAARAFTTASVPLNGNLTLTGRLNMDLTVAGNRTLNIVASQIANREGDVLQLTVRKSSATGTTTVGWSAVFLNAEQLPTYELKSLDDRVYAEVLVTKDGPLVTKHFAYSIPVQP